MTPDVVIHGGGYVGLTGAVHWALAGKQVLIYDPNMEVCEAINAGAPKAGEFLKYLSEHAGPEVFTRIRASSVLHNLAGSLWPWRAPVHVIAVPSERDGAPWVDLVLEVLDTIARNVEPGVDNLPTLVLIESTLTPGTVDRFLQTTLKGARPVITGATHHGAVYEIAVCPRRDWFADPTKNLGSLPRVVGGVTPRVTERACQVLSDVSQNILPTDYRTAELTKPLENALLHVPVMLAHEMAMTYPEHDIVEALRLAGTHWRLSQYYLNFGTGGRCVPLGSQYLYAGSKEYQPLLKGATDTEEIIRRLVAETAVRWATDGNGQPRGLVGVLGLAYRPEFRDAGSSAGVAIAKALVAKEVRTFVHDPMWTEAEILQMVPGVLPEAAFGCELNPSALLHFADVILLATPHQMYLDWPWTLEGAFRKRQIILDAQGAWNVPRAQVVFKARGVDYRQVGKPGWLK